MVSPQKKPLDKISTLKQAVTTYDKIKIKNNSDQEAIRKLKGQIDEEYRNIVKEQTRVAEAEKSNKNKIYKLKDALSAYGKIADKSFDDIRGIQALEKQIDSLKNVTISTYQGQPSITLYRKPETKPTVTPVATETTTPTVFPSKPSVTGLFGAQSQQQANSLWGTQSARNDTPESDEDESIGMELC